MTKPTPNVATVVPTLFADTAPRRWPHRTRRPGLLWLLVALAGCGEQEAPAAKDDTAGGSDVAVSDTLLDVAAEETAQSDAQTTDADADICPQPTHHDPPHFPYSCRDLGSYVYHKPTWYEDCIGDCCISQPTIVNELKLCPAGSLCKPPINHLSEPCQLPDCVTDTDCGEGLRCARGDATCGPTAGGRCLQATCTDGGSGAATGPACDCNGKTWPSACKAWEGGAAVVHSGACCDPVKLGLPADNPSGFTHLEICGTPSKWRAPWSGPPPGWTWSVNSARCGNTEAWLVPLATSATGTGIDAAQYQMLCSLVGDAVVKGAGGFGGTTCAGTPLAPVADCATGCTAPCGCKVGGVWPDMCTKQDGKDAIVHKKVTWCQSVTVCPEGTACVADVKGAACVGL